MTDKRGFDFWSPNTPSRTAKRFKNTDDIIRRKDFGKSEVFSPRAWEVLISGDVQAERREG